MQTKQSILRYAVAAVAALLILGVIALVLWLSFGRRDRDALTLFDPAHPELSRNDSRHARWMAQWERVPLAAIPWQRTGQPHDVTLPSATLPWAHNLATPAPTTVAIAQLPTLRPRRVLHNPEPAKIDLAPLPWGRDVTHPAYAHVPPAELPHLRPRRSFTTPEPVALPLARLPWAPAATQPHPVELPTAHLPARIPGSARTDR